MINCFLFEEGFLRTNLQQKCKQEDHEVVGRCLGQLLLCFVARIYGDGKRRSKPGHKVQGSLHGGLPLENDQRTLEETQKLLLKCCLVVKLLMKKIVSVTTVNS